MNKGALVIIVMGIIAILLAACEREYQKEVLATKIQYDVPIYSDDPQLDWWINNLEGSKRDPFAKRLLEAAEKGQVKAYDYFNEPLTPQQVLSLKVDTVYSTLTRAEAPYEEYDTVIYYELDYRDITKIRFLEEWKWDPETLEMEKKVLGIAPVTVIDFEGQEYNRPLFWIYLEENAVEF
jgi:hypothetical protein